MWFPLRVLVPGVILASLMIPGAASASLNQWHPVNLNLAGFGTTAMTSLPGDPGSLYVAGLDGFQRSGDGGVTWTRQASTTCQTQAMAVDPTDPMTIYLGCANGGGVEKSVDGGATWTAADQGLGDPTPSIDALAIDPADPATIYATTLSDSLGDVFKSTDSGASWTPIIDGLSGGGLAISDGRLYAYSDLAYTTSDDGGTSWTTPVAGSGNRLLADPTTPGTVYGFQTSQSTGQLSMTSDGGQTWTPVPSAPAGISDGAVLDGTLYLATTSGIWTTSDAGQTWTQTETRVGSNLRPTAIAADPADPGHVWVAAEPSAGIWEVTFNGSLTPGLVPYWMAGTLPATNVTPTSVVLDGVVAATAPSVFGQYLFDWGTTSSYGSQTPLGLFPEATQAGSDAPVSAALTGLTPATTYHVHLSALANWIGGDTDSRADDVTFTTPPAIAPTAGQPVITFRRAAVPGAALPAQVTWSVTPGTYPVCSSTLERSVDGHAYTRVALSTKNARSFTPMLMPGHRYNYRVQAVDCHGRAGAWSAVASTTAHLTAAAQFGPRWTPLRGGGHEATAAGARAVFTCTGRSVAIIAYQGSHYGRAAVYLDGARVATLDLHRAGSAQLRLVFAHRFAASGWHTVSLVVLADPAHPAVTVSSFAFVDQPGLIHR